MKSFRISAYTAQTYLELKFEASAYFTTHAAHTYDACEILKFRASWQ